MKSRLTVYRFRLAEPHDATAILAIYAPIVEKTAITFEFEVPSTEEMTRRIRATLERFPWIVGEDDRGVMGYAYAGTFRARAAYDWSVESSVYIASAAQRTGLGRALYQRLFAILALQGVRIVIGGIALPNAASVAMHEAMGFVPNGLMPAIGRKFDRWWDLWFWRLDLLTVLDDGRPPTALRVVRDQVDLALREDRLIR